MNQDQLKLIGQKLLKRIDLVTLGVLLALLAVAGYLQIQESGFAFNPIDNPPPVEFDDKVTANPNYQRIVSEYVQANPDVNQSESVRRAIQNNMFDRKSVEEQAKVQKELNDQYNRAEEMFNRGQTDQARRALEAILAKDANHGPANELMKRLDELAAPTATPEGQ